MCNSCGNEFAKWSGQCPACHEWNTLVEVGNYAKSSKARSRSAGSTPPVTPREAIKLESNQTLSTNIIEFDRVLGNGLTPGGVYLIAGQPGIGKSTLLTQLAISMSFPRKRESIQID